MVSQPIKVFASYSHADALLVGPVVDLLRANRALVFLDKDRIPPGQKWRDAIDKALADAHQVVVFWCEHAQGSVEVAGEWRKAIALNKDVLPLLLDATPLPSELAEYQWIDFRKVVTGSHVDLKVADAVPPRASAAPSAAPGLRRGSSWKIYGAAASLLVAISAGWWLLVVLGPSASHPLPHPDPMPGHLPQAGAPSLPVWIWVSSLVLIAGLVWWISRRMRRASVNYMPRIRKASSVDVRIARDVEAEILRRARAAASSK